MIGRNNKVVGDEKWLTKKTTAARKRNKNQSKSIVLPRIKRKLQPSSKWRIHLFNQPDKLTKMKM